MAAWDAFESEAPDLARRGRSLLVRSGAGEGLLTTIRGDALPRMHPVNVGIVDGRLLTFVLARSPKARDLALDGRYALHAHQDPTAPHEFLVRGRAALVVDPGLRALAASGWPFDPGDDCELFALDIEHAVLGARPHADAWPPVYTSWRSATAEAAGRAPDGRGHLRRH